MRLSIRYENKLQTIELNEKETKEMWISLSLEGDELSKKDKERLIQDVPIYESPQWICSLKVNTIKFQLQNTGKMSFDSYDFLLTHVETVVSMILA